MSASASVIQFPARGGYSHRKPLASEPALVGAEPNAGFTRTSSRAVINLGPKSIVIRWTTPATGETGAYCCPLTGLYLGRGYLAEICNSFRALVPGNLLLRALQACQQTARGISNALRSFRGFVALFHEQTMNRGEPHWNEKPFPNPTTALLRIR